MNYIKNQNTLTRLFVFFAIIVFLVSCNEENIIDSPENSLDVETSYISFDTKEDYANVFKDRSILSSKSTQSNFKSLKLAIEEFHTDPSARQLKNLSDTLYEDYGLLPEILNEDKVVKIGEHLIKVDLHSETVAVLPVSFKEQYDDLVKNNFDNENIMLFSTEDEVLTFLADGSKGTFNAKVMGCDAASARPRGKTLWSSNDKKRRAKLRVDYQTAGIYFSLLVKGKTQRKRFGGWFRHYDGWVVAEYICTYEVRCGRIFNNLNSPTRLVSDQGKASDRPYEDLSRLEYYYLRSSFISSNFNGNEVLEIRDNY